MFEKNGDYSSAVGKQYINMHVAGKDGYVGTPSPTSVVLTY